MSNTMWTVGTWTGASSTTVHGTRGTSKALVDSNGQGNAFKYITVDNCVFCGEPAATVYYCSWCTQHSGVCNNQQCKNRTVTACYDCTGYD